MEKEKKVFPMVWKMLNSDKAVLRDESIKQSDNRQKQMRSLIDFIVC